MGPTAYALCQKSIIGPAMWITGLCSFPPLIDSLASPLNVASATVSRPFSVPVDKPYQFLLEFEFASAAARLKDETVGTHYAVECDKNPQALIGKPEFGLPIPVRVVIRRSEDQAIVVDSQFVTLCRQSFVDNRKSRSIGWVTLARGEYIAEVINLAAQSGLPGTRTFVSLVPGGGK